MTTWVRVVDPRDENFGQVGRLMDHTWDTYVSIVAFDNPTRFVHVPTIGLRKEDEG